ncbi:MAG: glycosyltransferase family 4 protein [Cyclobacteriaceae bacterium]
MNVCIAYPNNPLNYSETFVQNHICGIKPSYTLTGGRRPFLDRSAQTIFHFPLSINLIRIVVKFFTETYYHRFFTRALVRYIERNKIEVILAEYGPVGVSFIDACNQTNTKLVVHFHGYDAFDKSTIRRFSSKYRLFNQSANKVIVVSSPMKDQMVHFGIHRDKIVKIPYGINPDLFYGAKPSVSEKLFVAVGRFTPKKAPLITIQAFEDLHAQDPSVRLIMIGDGDLLKEVTDYVDKKKLNSCISFVGVLTRDEIIKYLQKARAFVQHSMISEDGDSEGLPNSILEALSCGLPVVSTNHAGIPEVIEHGKNGFLVDEGDVLTMSRYMFELANSASLAQQLGEEGRKTIVNNYSLKKQIEILNNTLTN